MARLLTQTSALLRKNALVFKRSPLQLALVVLAPLVCLVFALLFDKATRTAPDAPTPDISVIDPVPLALTVPPCPAGSNCAQTPRIYYAPNDPYHAAVMDDLAANLGLRKGVDVVPLGSYQELSEMLTTKQQQIKRERDFNFGVSFTTFTKAVKLNVTAPGSDQPGKKIRFIGKGLHNNGHFPAIDANVPFNDKDKLNAEIAKKGGTHYTLWAVNQPDVVDVSPEHPDKFLPNIVSNRGINLVLKHAIDKAVIRTRADMQGLPKPDMDIRFSHFPLPGRIEDNLSATDRGRVLFKKSGKKATASSLVPAFIFLGFSPLLLVLSSHVANEKTMGLMSLLRRFGMREAAYWTAMTITVAVLVATGSLFSLIVLPFTDTDFSLSKLDFLSLFFAMFTGGFHFVSFGLIFASIFSTPYSINLFAGFLCAVMIGASGATSYADAKSGAGDTFPATWQDTYRNGWGGWLLSFLPVATFGKLYSELTNMASMDGTIKASFGNPSMYSPRDFVATGGVQQNFVGKTLSSNGDNRIGTVYLAGAMGFGSVKDKLALPPPIVTMVMMIVWGCLSSVISAYFNQVFGGSELWYFPILRSYWTTSPVSIHPEVDAEAEKNNELIVKNLKVDYKANWEFKFATKHAVADVSFTVRKGKVLSLLGPNGAGKSTTINALTGVVVPSAGIVSVFGVSRISDIQQRIGVTAQDDITWPLLTAAEHIRMFAVFRDVPGDQEAYMRDRLEQVGLEDHADQCVGEFSGGMRRRCCIVLSSIGSPPLIILDEPTSSLDPINRRKVWRFIQGLKAHSAVILTTHLLDEADALGDEVCIIDQGRVEASGTSLALKAQHGSGYEVSLIVSEGATLDAVSAMVARHAPNAIVTQRSSEMYAATLAKDQPIAPLLKYLQSDDTNRVELVRQWEVSNTTLEQVFLNVGERAGRRRIEELAIAKAKKLAASRGGNYEDYLDQVDSATDSDAESSKDADLAPFKMPKFVAHKSFGGQVLAVFYKARRYQCKQLLPTLMVYFVSIVVLTVMRGQSAMSGESMCPDGTSGTQLESSSSYLSYTPSAPRFGHQGDPNCNATINVGRIGSSMGLCSPGSSRGCLYGDFSLDTLLYSSSLNRADGPARFWIRDPTGKFANITALAEGVDPAPETPVRDESFTAPPLPAGHLASHLKKRFEIKVLPDKKLDPIATADKFGPRQFVTEHPAAIIKKNLAAMYAKSERMPALCPQFFYMYGEGAKSFITEDEDVYNVLRQNMPDYGFEVSSFSANATKLEIVVPPTSFEYSAAMYLSVTSRGKCHQAALGWPRELRTPAPTDIINEMNSDFTIHDTAYVPDMSAPFPLNSYSGHNQVFDWDLIEVLHGIANAQLTETLGSPDERIQGNVQAVPQINEPEVLPTISSMIAAIPLYMFLFAYLAQPFHDKETGMLQFYRVNGLSLSAYWMGNYMFSLMITLPVYLIALWIAPSLAVTLSVGPIAVLMLAAVHGMIAIGYVLAALVSSTLIVRLASFILPPLLAAFGALVSGGLMDGPIFAHLFPPVSFAVNMRLLALRSSINWAGLAISFASSTGYILLAVVVFIMQERVAARSGGKTSASEMTFGAAGAAVEAGQDDEDPEVCAERLKLAASAGDKPSVDDTNLAIKVVDVDKSFGAKHVLKQLTMGVSKGETYGLLGHNGCGKTTLLNILTGSSNPTSGSAWVGGQLTNRSDLSSVLGVVPQRDMVIRDLSVRENLIFFARLRGAPSAGDELTKLVERVTDLVGLTEAIDRASGKLSGGQRRRLSLAIAVIGSPQVILADEPSAGLDPATRMGVWKLLGRIREQGETVILVTTHSMAEADALCTRIGIMAGGRMRVLGNPVSLRKRYGSGHALHLQLPVSAPVVPAESLQERALAAESAAMDSMVAKLHRDLGLDGLKVKYEHQDALASLRARGGKVNESDAEIHGWEVRITIPLPPGTDLSAVFEYMAQAGDVVDFGIDQSSLEDVFIQVTDKYYTY
ncbi:hypothetical protein BC828DRAFT_397155 [Blastocladiella britannica]|nr:hypothetical protein BC828DRAFT_397155 [Blastocladiella britannica]